MKNIKINKCIKVTLNKCLNEDMKEIKQIIRDFNYMSCKAANKATWFTIVIPGLTKSFYFTGNPSSMGLPETSVSSVLEITNYITPTNAPEKFDKPTDLSE